MRGVSWEEKLVPWCRIRSTTVIKFVSVGSLPEIINFRPLQLY